MFQFWKRRSEGNHRDPVERFTDHEEVCSMQLQYVIWIVLLAQPSFGLGAAHFSNPLVAATSDHIPEKVRRLAPVLALHPHEEYMPVVPMDYIRDSRLRWHKSNRLDAGWSKRSNGWETSNSHDDEFYNIPVDFINQFGLNPDRTNRRPRDNNCGKRGNVFIEPKLRHIGSSEPDGIVPTFVHWEEDGDMLLAQFWFFFGYSDGWKKFNHEGDWEVIGIHSRGGHVVAAQFSAHGRKDVVPRSALEFYRGRVVGYCSRGTHAIYPSPGNFSVRGVHTDRASDSGYHWFTWENLKVLEDQPWKDFAGAWGQVGNAIFGGFTTGPLGPWHKLLRLGTFPKNWGVVLFEHNNYGGRRVEIGDNNADLQRTHVRFGDKASSLTYSVPEGWRLILYKHDGYREPLLELHPGKGSLSDLALYEAGDAISSIGWEELSANEDVPQWATGSVTLFEHDRFRGQQRSFSFGDSPVDLKAYRFGDKASSVSYSVPEGWEVRLYKHDNFRNPLVVLTGSGRISDLKTEEAGDEISSLRWVHN